ASARRSCPGPRPPWRSRFVSPARASGRRRLSPLRLLEPLIERLRRANQLVATVRGARALGLDREAATRIEALQPRGERLRIERRRQAEQGDGAIADDVDVARTELRFAARLTHQRGAIVDQRGLAERDCALPAPNRAETDQRLPRGKQHCGKDRQRDREEWRVERELERALRSAKTVCGHVEQDRRRAGAVEIIEQDQRRARLPLVAHTVVVDEVRVGEDEELVPLDLAEDDPPGGIGDHWIELIAGHRLDHRRGEKAKARRRAEWNGHQRLAVAAFARDEERRRGIERVGGIARRKQSLYTHPSRILRICLSLPLGKDEERDPR